VLCGYKLAGFKKSADFSENRRNLAGSARSKFKNQRFLEFKFRNIEKIGKLCKKLDQILRTLVEKFFQISTVLLDKIQIESKT
jgi:hypothetical protein